MVPECFTKLIRDRKYSLITSVSTGLWGQCAGHTALIKPGREGFSTERLHVELEMEMEMVGWLGHG